MPGEQHGQAVMSPPPESVLSGESVPEENQEEQRREAAIRRIMAALKTRPPYHTYSEAERREAAEEFYRRYE